MVLIGGAFIASAGLSILTMLKTTNIIQHADIYRKHRDYACSVEAADSEAFTTGSKQLTNFNEQMLDKALTSLESPELNPNPSFEKINPNEPDLLLGYRHTTVGDAEGTFGFNKQEKSVTVTAQMKTDSGGLAGWYMEYVDANPDNQYVYTVSFSLNAVEAKLVLEEVDGSGIRSYNDVVLLKSTNGRVTNRYVVIPASTTVKLRTYIQLSTQGTMTTYAESIRPLAGSGLDAPMVSITFDDGWGSVFDKARPVFEKYDVKTTQYIIAESFRSLLSGYMNLAQVQKLSQEGHEIASHSLRHCNLSKLNAGNFSYDLMSSKDTLETEFPKVTGFAYPFGAFTPEIKKAASKDYNYLRTTDSGYTNILMDKMELRAVTIDPTTTQEEFRAIVDEANAKKYWLILVYHKVDDSSDVYSLNPAALDKQIGYIKSTQVNVVTVSQGVGIVEKQQQKRFGLPR